jgi:hypothetical protein
LILKRVKNRCNLQAQTVSTTISSSTSGGGGGSGGSDNGASSNTNTNNGFSIPITSTVDSVSLGSVSIADASAFEGYQITISGGTSDATNSAASLAVQGADGSVEIVSTIFSIELVDSNGLPIHILPAPIEICFSVPENYVVCILFLFEFYDSMIL